MTNYSYKKFLSTARPALERSVSSAKEITDKLDIVFSLDQNFPWTKESGYHDAVGRCGLWEEEEDFSISIHLRAIYQCLREQFSNYLYVSEPLWEKDICSSIQETVFHETAHGIIRHFDRMTYDNDEFWNWCKEKGFDKTIFGIYQTGDNEEKLCEEYAMYNNFSTLGKFIQSYIAWEGKN